MRSASAIVSSATATRCCSSAILRVGRLGSRRCYNRPMHFEVIARCGQARRGKLKLAHGDVETPVFMPVGTYGTVKAMAPNELESLGAQIILGNTFHLWLRPGIEVVHAHAGL